MSPHWSMRGVPLYGAKLCENIVQATARDLLVEAILRLEAQELGVRFHIHDELVVEVPRAAAEDAASRVEQELSRVPEWAAGLPLACEVRIACSFGKDAESGRAADRSDAGSSGSAPPVQGLPAFVECNQV